VYVYVYAYVCMHGYMYVYENAPAAGKEHRVVLLSTIRRHGTESLGTKDAAR
jgi:hypothetical protein